MQNTKVAQPQWWGLKASAVAVGTANFIDPTTPMRVLEGIEAYLRRHGMNAVAALTGSLRTE